MTLPDIFNKRKLREQEQEKKAILMRQEVMEQQLKAVTLSMTLNNISTQLQQQTTAIYPSYDLTKQVERYSTTDDIYSILRLISTTGANIPIWAYERSADGSLADLPETDKFYRLMESPHMTLSKYEFIEAILLLLPLQGEVILYKVRTDVGVNAGLPQKLEFLESQYVEKRVSGAPFFNIVSYSYKPNGIPLEGFQNIPPEDIIHIRYFQTLSPLQVLKKRLVRLDAAMDGSVAQLQNGGTPTIIYHKGDTTGTVDASGMAVDVAGRHKENYYNFTQHRGNVGNLYWAGDGELGAISTGLKLADLEVADLAKIDFKKLCNAFNVSDRLLNNDATGSEVSDDNARKGLYTNAVLPDVRRVIDAINNQLAVDFNKQDRKQRVLKEDISEIPELQADMLKMAQAIAALPTFIPNEVRETFRQDKSTDPIAEKMFIKTGYVPIEDALGEVDLPETDDYLNE